MRSPVPLALALAAAACSRPAPTADAHAVGGRPDCPAIVQLAPGDQHNCVVRADGTAACWGDNSFGQLGAADGVIGVNHSPALVAGLAGVTQIALGERHTCALEQDGSVWCWGDDGHGQLGIGSLDKELRATRVPGLSGVVEIALGYYQTCARKGDGAVLCWGINMEGEVGDGTTDDRLSPTPVPMLAAERLELGQYDSAAIAHGGVALGWGQNTYNQLGGGPMTLTSPTPVPGLGPVADLALGGEHSCALMPDGTAACWGLNNLGQLGTGSTDVGQHPQPGAVVGLAGAEQIATGYEHSCARKGDGTVWCWGSNIVGQLGRGEQDGDMHPLAAPVPGLADVVDIGLAGDYSCARRKDGEVLCWGWNISGQLGDGTMVDRHAPTRVDACF